LSEWASYYERNPFDTYEPIRPLLAFHQSTHLRRMIRAPNRIGKTYSGAWECWAHLIGRHRWRGTIKHDDGIVMVANMEKVYPEVCRTLWAVAPRDALDPATKYIPGKGFYTNGARFVRARNGKVITFRSGEGSAMSTAAAAAGWLWGDELPKQDRFGEALSRVAVAEGPVWWTFTPINRPAAWLRQHVEGNPRKGIPPAEDWIQFRPQLTEADCTTISGLVIRSTRSIERQTAGYTASEIRQRVYGDWEGISENRALSCFNEMKHVRESVDWDDPDSIEVGIGFDHGEHIGNQVAVLFLYQITDTRRLIHIIDCYVAAKPTTEEEDAAEVLLMLARNRVNGSPLSLLNVDKMVGDINSAGKAGGGRKVNARLAEEMAKQAGHPGVIVPIDNARKGRIKDGIRTLNLGFLRDEVFIDPGCTSLLESVRYWDNTPQSEGYKHLIDALRYPLVPLLQSGDDDNAPEVAGGRLELRA
jgi:hypothetical protein